MRFSEQTDDVKTAVRDLSQEGLLTIMASLMALLVVLGLITVLCSVLLVISKRQEAMLEELLKRSGSMQETSVLINPETRSQAERLQNGSGR